MLVELDPLASSSMRRVRRLQWSAATWYVSVDGPLSAFAFPLLSPIITPARRSSCKTGSTPYFLIMSAKLSEPAPFQARLTDPVSSVETRPYTTIVASCLVMGLFGDHYELKLPWSPCPSKTPLKEVRNVSATALQRIRALTAGGTQATGVGLRSEEQFMITRLESLFAFFQPFIPTNCEDASALATFETACSPVYQFALFKKPFPAIKLDSESLTEYLSTGIGRCTNPSLRDIVSKYILSEADSWLRLANERIRTSTHPMVPQASTTFRTCISGDGR